MTLNGSGNRKIAGYKKMGVYFVEKDKTLNASTSYLKNETFQSQNHLVSKLIAILACLFLFENCVYTKLEYPEPKSTTIKDQACPWNDPTREILVLAYGKICIQDRIVSGEVYNTSSKSYTPYNIRQCARYSDAAWYPLEFFYKYGPKSQIYLKWIRDNSFLSAFEKVWQSSPLLTGLEYQSYLTEIRDRKPILVKLYSDHAEEVDDKTIWLFSLGFIPKYYSAKMKYSISTEEIEDLQKTNEQWKGDTSGSVIEKGGWLYLFWGIAASLGTKQQGFASLLKNDLLEHCAPL